MSSTSVGVAPPGECLRSKGRYGSCLWQIKLCDSFANGPYLNALEMRYMTKHYIHRRFFLCAFILMQTSVSCWLGFREKLCIGSDVNGLVTGRSESEVF